MANLTKAEREKRDAENETKLKEELEKKIRAEYEKKLKEATKNTPISTTVKAIKKKIPLDTMVPVRSGFQGILVFVSKKTGYEVRWSEYGALEYLELSDLVAMRNASKFFFANNWIYFDDTDEFTAQEVYEFLNVATYYNSNYIGQDLEKILGMSVDEIKTIVPTLPKGVKEQLATTARIKIEEGVFDSNNRIKALEEVLDVELASSL